MEMEELRANLQSLKEETASTLDIHNTESKELAKLRQELKMLREQLTDNNNNNTNNNNNPSFEVIPIRDKHEHESKEPTPLAPTHSEAKELERLREELQSLKDGISNTLSGGKKMVRLRTEEEEVYIPGLQSPKESTDNVLDKGTPMVPPTRLDPSDGVLPSITSNRMVSSHQQDQLVKDVQDSSDVMESLLVGLTSMKDREARLLQLCNVARDDDQASPPIISGNRPHGLQVLGTSNCSNQQLFNHNVAASPSSQFGIQTSLRNDIKHLKNEVSEATTTQISETVNLKQVLRSDPSETARQIASAESSPQPPSKHIDTGRVMHSESLHRDIEELKKAAKDAIANAVRPSKQKQDQHQHHVNNEIKQPVVPVTPTPPSILNEGRQLVHSESATEALHRDIEELKMVAKDTIALATRPSMQQQEHQPPHQLHYQEIEEFKKVLRSNEPTAATNQLLEDIKQLKREAISPTTTLTSPPSETAKLKQVLNTVSDSADGHHEVDSFQSLKSDIDQLKQQTQETLFPSNLQSQTADPVRTDETKRLREELNQLRELILTANVTSDTADGIAHKVESKSTSIQPTTDTAPLGYNSEHSSLQDELTALRKAAGPEIRYSSVSQYSDSRNKYPPSPPVSLGTNNEVSLNSRVVESSNSMLQNISEIRKVGSGAPVPISSQSASVTVGVDVRRSSLSSLQNVSEIRKVGTAAAPVNINSELSLQDELTALKIAAEGDSRLSSSSSLQLGELSAVDSTIASVTSSRCPPFP
eukprot:TRINITY_DN5650_c0_g1_i1.p1 TRINITY_DN5650_c0_g1~~TRINITY_DN5650_c0_g1_i1.p1  ORF type:complete len:830 (+),score=212.75 TRINITY_DN5650_c0_g1_i1:208-2490(+)